MTGLGLLFAGLSGVANGLFTAPMKMIPRWKWENIWLVFIVVACLLMPAVLVFGAIPDYGGLLRASPPGAVRAAVVFGFAWGFGAILFGLSVDRLGVSLANTLVIGISSALGSLVPLILQNAFRADLRTFVLLAGVATFIVGVAICGRAGKLREGASAEGKRGNLFTGLLFSTGSGIMSAVFNIGYSLALPIATAGEGLGYSTFAATNAIWLLMLGAGSIPNIVFCVSLLARHGSAPLYAGKGCGRGFGLASLMGILWGGSIFLYGAATPRLGDIGPSIGWPLSLAVGLLVANLMGLLLGEWRDAPDAAKRLMRNGILTLVAAIILCATSSAIRQ